MNRNVITGILLLCIVGSLLTIILIMSDQNSSPEIFEPKTHHVQEERVIASFGQDQIKPGQSVVADNLENIDTLIKVTEEDIDIFFYPNGPVLGYGRDIHGSIIIWMDEDQTVNQTVINEIYQRVSAKGKIYNITPVPCRFISSGKLTLDIAKDTMP